MRGSAASAMWQVEVPATRPICRSSAGAPWPAPRPSTPSAPACASIRPQPTWQAVVRPSSSAASGDRVPSVAPIGLAAPGSAARSSRSSSPTFAQKIRLPARRLVGEVGPLAGHRAAGARVRAAGAPGQKVGEVEDPPVVPPALRQMALQPHELRDLHLGRHRAADEIQHRGGRSRCIPAPRRSRGGRARPRRSSAPRRWSRPQAGPARPVERHQRAGGIEADPRDRLGSDAGLGPRRARRGADRPPDVVGILLGMVRRRPVHGDRPAVPGEHPAAARRTGPARALPVPTSTAITTRSFMSCPPRRDRLELPPARWHKRGAQR